MTVMKKISVIFSLLIFCFSGANSQTQTNKNLYRLKGVFKTQDSSVISEIRIDLNNNGQKSSAFTDINGEFDIELASGDYELTVSKEVSDTFIAFIKIEENGLNPNFLEFTLEPNPNPCGAISADGCPKMLSFIVPNYPNTARAVRALGEVVVSVKIDKEGKVMSALAESGHTLLKKSCEQAARKSLFAPSDKDDVREVKLIFVFLRDEATKKENIKQYFIPYRMIINPPYL